MSKININTYYSKFASAYLKERQCTEENIPLDFKRKNVLPRVKKTLGIIKGLCPDQILDIGYGRGAFLYPLLETNPQLKITIIDNDPRKIDTLVCLSKGGVHNIFPTVGDVQSLPFQDNVFDLVTALEVVEHLPNPLQGIKEIMRVSKKFAIISVPSKPDNNIQHLHFFGKEEMTELCNAGGAKNVSFEWVNGHMITIARVA